MSNRTHNPMTVTPAFAVVGARVGRARGMRKSPIHCAWLPVSTGVAKT